MRQQGAFRRNTGLVLDLVLDRPDVNISSLQTAIRNFECVPHPLIYRLIVRLCHAGSFSRDTLCPGHLLYPVGPGVYAGLSALAEPFAVYPARGQAAG